MFEQCIKLKPEFYFNNWRENRNLLFEKALECSKDGKVLYILHEEFKELPQVSYDGVYINRHNMKMISFLYVKDLDSLIESISTLPDWQNVPYVIILEGLDEYCLENKQTACGLVSLFVDTVRSCSVALQKQCCLFISANKEAYTNDFCTTLQDLYSFPSFVLSVPKQNKAEPCVNKSDSTL